MDGSNLGKLHNASEQICSISLLLPDRRWPSLPPKMLQTWRGTELASWLFARQSCTSPSLQRLTDAALAFSKASSQGVWILHHRQDVQPPGTVSAMSAQLAVLLQAFVWKAACTLRCIWLLSLVSLSLLPLLSS